MSEYRQRTTGQLKSKTELTRANPDVSLPSVWTKATHDFLGVDPVLRSPKPTPSGAYKSVVRNGVTLDANGNWIEAWTEVDTFTDIPGGLTAEEQIAEHEAREASVRRSKHRCTARQARLALSASGSLSAVESLLQGAGAEAVIEWEYANEIERSSPLIASMAAGMGWTEEELDTLFETAVTL